MGSSWGVGVGGGGVACVPVRLLAVGVFALNQIRTLQGDACKQAPGSAVGEDGSRAAERHVGLHVPGGRPRQAREKSFTLLSLVRSKSSSLQSCCSCKRSERSCSHFDCLFVSKLFICMYSTFSFLSLQWISDTKKTEVI